MFPRKVIVEVLKICRVNAPIVDDAPMNDPMLKNCLSLLHLYGQLLVLTGHLLVHLS